MYRLRFRTFLLAQPFYLVSTLPLESGLCRWAVAQHEGLVVATFGGLREWGRVLLAAVVSPAAGWWASQLQPSSAYASCMQVHMFMMVVLGFALPGVVIWRLERQTWLGFLNADPRSVLWEGGPSAEQAALGLERLRREECARETPSWDVRVGAAVFLGAVVLWHALGLVLV